MKKPLFIATADIHLRNDRPTCRTDDYLKAQREKLQWLNELQMQLCCPVLDAGDLFHRAKSPPWVIREAAQFLPESMYTIPGNHDLPQHSMEMIRSSAIGVLDTAPFARVRVLKGGHIAINTPAGPVTVFAFPYGSEPYDINPAGQGFTVALVHSLVYSGVAPWAGCTGMTDAALMRKLSGFRVIVTGDNHQTFGRSALVDGKRQLLINPGSMMRMTAAQVDHRPAVAIVYAASDDHDFRHISYDWIYYPAADDVVSNQHIIDRNEKNQRITAFVEKMRDDCEISLSFEKNLEAFLSSNGDIPARARKIVWEAIEQE